MAVNRRTLAAVAKIQSKFVEIENPENCKKLFWINLSYTPSLSSCQWCQLSAFGVSAPWRRPPPPTWPLKSYQRPEVWKNLRPTFWTNLNLSFYRQTASAIILRHRRIFWKVKFLDLWRDPSFSYRIMTLFNVHPMQSPIRLEIRQLRYEDKSLNVEQNVTFCFSILTSEVIE